MGDPVKGKILFLGIFERVQYVLRVSAVSGPVEGKILFLVIFESVQYLLRVCAVSCKERFSSLVYLKGYNTC